MRAHKQWLIISDLKQRATQYVDIITNPSTPTAVTV